MLNDEWNDPFGGLICVVRSHRKFFLTDRYFHALFLSAPRCLHRRCLCPFPGNRYVTPLCWYMTFRRDQMARQMWKLGLICQMLFRVPPFNLPCCCYGCLHLNWDCNPLSMDYSWIGSFFFVNAHKHPGLPLPVVWYWAMDIFLCLIVHVWYFDWSPPRCAVGYMVIAALLHRVLHSENHSILSRA